MTKTLREYVKEKFILSNYKKTILNKADVVGDMFIEVASTFGYSEPKAKSNYSSYYYSTGVQDSSGLYFYDQNVGGKTIRVAYLDYINYGDIKDEEMKKNSTDKYGVSIYTDVNGNLWYMCWARSQMFPAKYEHIKNEEKRKQYDEYLKSLEVKEKNNEENLLDSTKYAFIGELLMKKFYYGTDKKFYMSEKNSPKTLVNDSTNDFGYCQHLLSKITQNV